MQIIKTVTPVVFACRVPERCKVCMGRAKQREQWYGPKDTERRQEAQ